MGGGASWVGRKLWVGASWVGEGASACFSLHTLPQVYKMAEIGYKLKALHNLAP